MRQAPAAGRRTSCVDAAESTRAFTRQCPSKTPCVLGPVVQPRLDMASATAQEVLQRRLIRRVAFHTVPRQPPPCRRGTAPRKALSSADSPSRRGAPALPRFATAVDLQRASAAVRSFWLHDLGGASAPTATRPRRRLRARAGERSDCGRTSRRDLRVWDDCVEDAHGASAISGRHAAGLGASARYSGFVGRPASAPRIRQSATAIPPPH